MRSHNSLAIFIRVTLETDFGVRFSNVKRTLDNKTTDIYLDTSWYLSVETKDPDSPRYRLALCQIITGGGYRYNEFNLWSDSFAPEASIPEQDKQVLLWLNQAIAFWRAQNHT